MASGDGPAGRKRRVLVSERGKLMIHQHISATGPARLSCLFIGRDRSGHWVVKDARSLCGGLFTNRTEAIRFAKVECQRPQSVIMLPDGLELDGPLSEDRLSEPAKRRAA
jgi:hypothetical protein